MHKTNSRNAQARAFNSVLNNRCNDAGLAPGVFKAEDAGPQTPEERKQELVREKIRVSRALTDIKSRMAAADANRQRTGRYVPRGIWLEWTEQRAALVAELQEIEFELAATKVLARRAYEASEVMQKATFSECFMQTARMMLTQEAYDRIIVATTHRLADAHEADNAQRTGND